MKNSLRSIGFLRKLECSGDRRVCKLGLCLATFGLWFVSSPVLSHDKNQDSSNAQSLIQHIQKGDRVVIDMLNLCSMKFSTCKAEHLYIKSEPVEGILFKDERPAVWAYQHAGTSTLRDTIVVGVKGLAPTESQFSVHIEVALFTASVRITAPADGSEVDGRNVIVKYETNGTGFDHLHLQISNSDHVSVYTNKGSHEFLDLASGWHTITATLARSDHRSIPGTTQSIRIRVLE